MADHPIVMQATSRRATEPLPAETEPVLISHICVAGVMGSDPAHPSRVFDSIQAGCACSGAARELGLKKIEGLKNSQEQRGLFWEGGLHKNRQVTKI